MQTIWKGTVSFGLVSIPVRLYSATEERDVSFRQVHRDDGGRIRYKRVCDIDGEEVAYRDIAKGYEMPDGEMVVLDKEDFESLPLTSSRVIDVLQFVPVDQLDPLMMARSYYLSADGPGAKPYVLLRDALESTGRAAIVKVALRNREQLAALSTRGDVLVLQTMLWPDEVRDASGLVPDEDITVRDQEVAMAESYIETLTGDFHAEEYTDEYRHALEELIAAKAGGASPEALEERSSGEGTVVDLMAALRASVEAAKARRGQAAAAGSGGAGPVGAGEESVEESKEASAAARSAGEGGSGGRGRSTRKPVAGDAAPKAPPKKATATSTSASKVTAKKASAGDSSSSTETPSAEAPSAETAAATSRKTGARRSATKATGRGDTTAKRAPRKTA